MNVISLSGTVMEHYLKKMTFCFSTIFYSKNCLDLSTKASNVFFSFFEILSLGDPKSISAGFIS